MYLRPNSNVCVNFLFIVFLILSTLSVLCGLFCIWFSLSSPSQCPHLVITCLGFCRIDPGDQLSLSNHSPRLHKIITSAALCECECVCVFVCWGWACVCDDGVRKRGKTDVMCMCSCVINLTANGRTKSLTSCIVAVMWPDVDSRHHAQRTTILTILTVMHRPTMPVTNPTKCTCGLLSAILLLIAYLTDVQYNDMKGLHAWYKWKEQEKKKSFLRNTRTQEVGGLR